MKLRHKGCGGRIRHYNVAKWQNKNAKERADIYHCQLCKQNVSQHDCLPALGCDAHFAKANPRHCGKRMHTLWYVYHSQRRTYGYLCLKCQLLLKNGEEETNR